MRQFAGEVYNLAADDEVLEDAGEATEPQGEGADQVAPQKAVAEGAASGAPAPPASTPVSQTSFQSLTQLS